MKKNYKTQLNWFLTLISGVLFNLSYPPFNYYPLAYISLVPLFYVLLNSENNRTVFLYGAGWGISFNIIYLFWIKIFHILALPAILFAMAIYYGTLLLITKILITKFKRLSYIIVPSVWVSIEYIRSIGFLGFPWGLVYQSQWNFTSLIQIASVFGSFFITYLIILGNFIIAKELKNFTDKKKIYLRKVIIFTTIIITLAIWGKFRIKRIEQAYEKSISVRAALIQPSVDPNIPFEKIRYKVLSELTVLSEKSALYEPDIIVWSETAILDYIKYYLKNQEKLKKYDYFQERINYARNVVRLAKDLNVYLFTGIPDFEKHNNKEFDYNAAVLISPDGEILDTYRKNHLVPFGEWFPYNIPIIKKILESTFAGNFTPSTRKTVFNMVTKNKNIRFSCLICYEGVFSDLTRKFVLNGAEFLINITNDMWSFSEKAEFQHFIADVFRAVENNVAYIRSANSGVTGIIYPDGKVGKIAPLFKKTFIIADVPVIKNKNYTLYTVLGDFFPKFLLIFVFILLILVLVNKIKEQKFL